MGQISYISRKARAEDAETIRRMIAQAHLNPMGLDWQRFLIIEEQGHVIGIGQIKQHGDGSRELASLAVVPTHQGRGIGTLIIETLLAQEQGTLYLMCAPTLETYYQRFGFVKIARDRMPPYFKRIMGFVMPLFGLLRGISAKMPTGPIVMRRLETSDASK